MRARLSVARNEGDNAITAPTPDAWAVLRQARANNDGSADGVSLNHVITTDSYGLNPFTANPFTANPFTANPFTANPFTANALGVGIASYGAVGFGGRQPVTYLGREPVPKPDPNPAKPMRKRTRLRKRPVVAVFDTGLGDAPVVPRRRAPRPHAAERAADRHPATRHRS